jgi:membrane protease YdiL (CAAX protease family)
VARRTTRSLAVSLCLAAASAFAEGPIDIEADFSPGTHQRFAERVNQAQTLIYRDVLAAYDERRRRHPDDVTSQIERCRFIETFSFSEDQYIESAAEDLDACREALKSGPHASNVDVILYGVEPLWGAEEVPKAQALIPESSGWTPEQQATLFELLTDKVRWDDADLASQYATRALELKPGSRQIITAVERWIQFGAKDKARKLLIEAPPSTWETVPRYGAAKLLVDLGEAKAAAALLQGDTGKTPDGDNLMLARILADTGELAAARKLYLDHIATSKFIAHETRLEYFEFERKHGRREAAIAAYDQLRNEGFGADILGRSRLALSLSHPLSPWHWQDGLGLLILIGIAIVVLAIPLVAIVPVHYRGLARRVAGIPPDKAEPLWKLRHAWYALGAFSLVGLVSLYVFAPQALELMLPWTKRTDGTTSDIALGHELFWSTVVCSVLLIPLFRGRAFGPAIVGRWSVVKSLLVGIGLAFALKLVAVIVGFANMKVFGALGTDTIRAMQGAQQTYGLAGMLLIVAVAVPFVEELVFRGVMLEAFRGQVSFMLATLVQALTFCAIHESFADMPFLLAFALVAGWLAKRSEGLLAPMAMHSVNNLLAGLAIVGVTNVLNR